MVVRVAHRPFGKTPHGFGRRSGCSQGVTGELFGLRVEAESGSGELFARERRVYLAFFAKQVSTNKSDVFTVTANSAVQKDYPFDGHAEIEVQLLDAETKELLDKAVITQTKARDMGGLL